MESKSTFKEAPVETFTPDVEAHDVFRLDEATDDIEGPVVMNGRACADSFCRAGILQAGVPKKSMEQQMADIMSDAPRKSAW